ncbi:hypothetical protein HYX10_03640 [Candidatus Woesearchaeota archaeon]|nr:hypothetical protein [Candidatus Woesearchaeota archaeon]
MEIRKITKTDKRGKRLFVEIGKKMKSEADLPALKKGDQVLVMTQRKLTPTQMQALVGKYVKFFDISDEDSYALSFEGIVAINKPDFWGRDDDKSAKFKYALLEQELGPIDAFDDLNYVFDLQVIPGRERHVNKVSCYKCKKQFFEAYRYCPHCGKHNQLFRDEIKNGKMVYKQKGL